MKKIELLKRMSIKELNESKKAILKMYGSKIELRYNLIKNIDEEISLR